MSATIDANVLLYASDTSSPHHDPARAFLRRITTGPDLTYLFWPVIMSYLRIATHSAIFERPLDPKAATQNVANLLLFPHIQTESEGERFWDLWQTSTAEMSVRGNLVPDAHLVALMREHGVRTIYTRDRDFRRFDGIRVADPFAQASEPR